MREQNPSQEFLGPIVRKDTADEIRKGRKEGNNDKAKEISVRHHERARNTAEAVETQAKDRSVAELTKKGFVFAHGMPVLEGQDLISSSTQNNLALKDKNLSPLERLNLVMEKSPVLSTSTLGGKRYQLGSAYPTGILLADGFVQQGYASDEGTMALDSNTRVSKYQETQNKVKVQENIDFDKIEKEIDDLGQELLQSGRRAMYHYNEYVVSKPDASSLYINLDYFNKELRSEHERKSMGDERFNNWQDKGYFLQSIDENKTRSLIALNELSKATGLPIMGLRAENGKLKVTKLEIDDSNYQTLKNKKAKLTAELDELGKVKNPFDPEIDQKYTEIEEVDKELGDSEKLVTMSEIDGAKIPSGRAEAEEIRKAELLKNIKGFQT